MKIIMYFCTTCGKYGPCYDTAVGLGCPSCYSDTVRYLAGDTSVVTKQLKELIRDSMKEEGNPAVSLAKEITEEKFQELDKLVKKVAEGA